VLAERKIHDLMHCVNRFLHAGVATKYKNLRGKVVLRVFPIVDNVGRCLSIGNQIRSAHGFSATVTAHSAETT
jgi:hypothetical protein